MFAYIREVSKLPLINNATTPKWKGNCMKKSIGTEKRNIRFGVSLTKTDYNTLNKLSKKTKLSKAEIVIRAIEQYKMQIELNKNLLDKVYEK